MPHSTHRLSYGFSLVEIMIGMVIGMLGIIVMMQIFALAEGQKRATTGGGDALNSGAIALYGVQRDIRQAGYGFSALNLFNCNVTMPSGATIPLVPVSINPAAVPAGDANSDTLLVMYGNANGTPQGNVINALAGPVYTVSTPSSFAVGDRVIAVPAACAANLLVDQVNAVAANVTVATGVAGVATLYNLGQLPKVLGYAIRNGNLTVCDYFANDCSIAGSVGDPTIWVPIASNIVSLRAQYGHDTLTAAITFATPPVPLPNYVVDTYDQTTPTAVTAFPTPCGWARIPAVRVVLAARSGQYEKDLVTTAAPVWEGSTVVAGSATGANNPTALPIDLTANTDWQHYRYKLFQTVVPIRNIAWMGVQSGC
ncbi:MAG: PilW family protein [Sterolibacterium sp.]